VSSAFVPVETIPEWLQPIAEYQPITPVIESIRALLMDQPLGDDALWAVVWCVAIVAVSVAWGSWLFRRKAGRR
jgi:ABC-2 type transport system permease protein